MPTDRVDRPETSPRWWDVSLLAAVGLAGLFAVVAWQSVQHVNTLWDECNDRQATLALLKHPLWGSGIDGSQARLPMYVTALAYWCFGTSLSVARGVSIVVGAATIVVTFVLGRRWFGRSAGLLAAALLALSPYFLGFSRTALTEGDAFCPLPVLLLIWAFHGYLPRRDTRSVFLLGAALGLALATKFYSVLLVPPLVVCDFVQYRLEPTIYRSAGRDSPPEHRSLVYWGLTTLAIIGLGMGVTQAYPKAGFIAVICWFGGLSLLMQGVVRFLVRRPGDPQVAPWPAWQAWLAIPLVAAVVCLVVCPEHVVQPEVARALLRRFVRHDHVLPMRRVIDPARLYAGIVLLKLGLPLGLLTVSSLVWAWIRSPVEPVLRTLLATVVLYVLLLTTLPLRQCYYLMSIYPLLVLLLAASVVRIGRALRDRPTARAAWSAAVMTGGLWLLLGVIRVYPDFGLYGYETVGSRWLGGESRGYRNLVQVTNDGTEDALRWCLEHVPPGRRVVSYLWDDHVIDAFVRRYPPPFELVRRLPQADAEQGPAIEDADLLLLSLNNMVSYYDGSPSRELKVRFRNGPVYTVSRGRAGYAMPVVWIYER